MWSLIYEVIIDSVQLKAYSSSVVQNNILILRSYIHWFET